jgi:predicted DNA-binding transcriptional regulator AlpA
MTLSVNIVGAGEIAQRAGVAKATVWSWQKRHSDFPAPVQLEMGPVWDWAEVEAWLRARKPIEANHQRKSGKQLAQEA